MAKYTLELRTIIKDIDIFDFDYPFYDEKLKPYFEERFIDHFYFREIGFETIGRFKHYLKDKLHEIAPYYNHYYKTTIYEYNPLLNYDVKENVNRSVKNDNKSSATRNNSISDKTSGSTLEYDTPITPMSNARKTPSFMTEGDNTNNTSVSESTSNNGSNNTNEEYSRIMQGNIGVMATQDLIIKEREVITNINKMMFNELEELFIQVF